MNRHTIATIEVDLVDGQYQLTVETDDYIHMCERMDTLVGGFALATELVARASDRICRQRLQERSADHDQLTESALRDNRIVLGAGDVP